MSFFPMMIAHFRMTEVIMIKTHYTRRVIFVKKEAFIYLDIILTLYIIYIILQ